MIGKPCKKSVPLQWAFSTENHGVTLMLLAERTGDSGLADTAASQIELALTTQRDSSLPPFAEYYSSQLPKGRALVDRLSKR
jgi:hypothetical protein